MKKIIFTAAAVFAFAFSNAQEGRFKLGVHVGLPIGNIKDSSPLNLGADVAYSWNIDSKFSAGLVTGYTSYLAKTYSYNDGTTSFKFKPDPVGFIPVAGTAKYSVSDNLFIGADLGYAIYVGKNDGQGGLYYQPKFGYENEKVELYLGYKGISVDGGAFSSLNLGFNFKL